MKAMRLLMIGAIGCSFVLTGCGKKVTTEEARDITLKDAGLSEKEVRFTSEKIDDDGFEFSFHTDKKAYIYEISERGKIEEISTSNYTTPQNDKTNENQQTQAPSADKEAAMLTQEQALEKAIAHFKVDAAAITNLQIYQENDDGIQVYDIEFVYDGKEYSAEVDVTSGAITSSDIDTIH